MPAHGVGKLTACYARGRVNISLNNGYGHVFRCDYVPINHGVESHWCHWHGRLESNMGKRRTSVALR